MAYIRRYTSPTQELLVEGVNLTASEVFVSYKNGDLRLTFTGADIEMEAVESDTIIRVWMSQETTALFNLKKDLEVQVNWIEDGQRNATTIEKVTVARNLLEEVIA